MKIAAVQMDLAWEDRQANYDSARRWSELAAGDGADLILLPEMFATGFSMNPAVTAEEEDGPTASFLKGLSRDLQLVVVGGYVRRADSGKGINTALTCGPGGQVLAEYAKTHLIGILGENEAHEAGSAPVTFKVNETVCTCFVCYDLRFPELFRLVAPQCQLMMVMASWPSARQAHWDVLLQARAIENQCFVVGVNRVGEGGGLRFDGGSVIIDPVGKVLAHGGKVEGLVMAEVDTAQVNRVRTELPFLEDRRF